MGYSTTSVREITCHVSSDLTLLVETTAVVRRARLVSLSLGLEAQLNVEFDEVDHFLSLKIYRRQQFRIHC